MAEDDKSFLKRLHETFAIEAREHLAVLFSKLMDLEQAEAEPHQETIVETIFREAHSLKGAAGSMGLSQIERTCQALESNLAAIKRKEIRIDAGMIDSLHHTVNRIEELLAEHLQEQSSSVVPEKREEPKAATALPPPAKAIASVTEERLMAGTVRITTEKLDSIFMKAEEMLAAKLFAQHRKQELHQLNAQVEAWGKVWANIKVRHPEFYLAVAKQPQGLELLEENASFIKKLTHDLAAISKAADLDQRMLGRMTDDLLEGMKTTLLLPCALLLDVFPKLVRALAKDQGKEIELAIQGGTLEIDRRILEEIKDPLIHLVRNCVDHGIEQPAKRIEQGKPPRGKIEIAVASRSGDWVEIRVSDDGAGVNLDKVKQAAKRMGIVGDTDLPRIEDQNALELIFQSGVSTSPIVTEISGRGLGLAIVREKVQKLGGTISIESQPGHGTSFFLMLPNTLATYRGILVRVGEQQFVLPTRNVERSLRIRHEAVHTVENLETLRVGEETLAFARLSDVLGLPTGNDAAFLQVIVLSSGGKKIAFGVDEIVNEQEVLVKSLGKQLARIRNIEAATILGSGKAVPVLNASDLLKSALQISGRERRAPPPQKMETAQQEKSILVAEDSITSRSLLKGILEMAGYKVTTAVDGFDAMMRLLNNDFDLVVSDVEMPRMDGFDLTARIRADKRLQELPVVLVTALESPRDRERGIEVGANAYIVKRSFEQSNLLEVIQRLI